MGKKKSIKHQASALAAKKKQTRPDDYFRRGPIEMARFGKHIVMRNNMTPDQHRQYMRHVADQLPLVITKGDFQKPVFSNRSGNTLLWIRGLHEEELVFQAGIPWVTVD